jgi:transposase-like protein
MGEKQTILRHYFIDGWGIKKISREMNLARNTVREYVREFSAQKEEILAGGDKYSIIEAMQDPPKYDTESRRKTVVTGEVIEFIKKSLAENDRKRATGKHKLCQNSTDIHRELLKAGYDISYPSVVNTVRYLTERRLEAFIKQVYEPGEVCEFDWGGVTLTIGGKDTSYKMAVFTLAAKNIRYAYLYHNENTQSYMDSHIKAFSYFKGIPHLMVYDNMHVAIAKFVGQYEKQPTAALTQMAAYYGFSFRFCNIRKANEKGHVERSVDYIRRMAFSAKDIFDTEQAAMDALAHAIDSLNTDNGGIEEERAGMLPKMPDYSSANRCTGLVDKWSTVVSGTNHYSVPDYLVGKEVEVQSHIDMIIVKYRGEEVARHEKSYRKKQFIMDIYHYRETLKRKPGALNSSLCLKQSPKVLQDVFSNFFKGEPKEFIATLIEFHEYSIFQINQACETLRDSGVKIGCDAIRMVLANKTEPENEHENEPDEIEMACLRQLRQFAGRRCSA